MATQPLTLAQQVSDILEKRFAGASARLEVASPSSKVGGFLIWSGFDGKDQVDRQRELWSVLRASLLPSELPQLTAILTLTPAEEAEYSED